MNKTIKKIKYQAGELYFYIDENQTAVLQDYVGNDVVLYLPTELTYNGISLNVSKTIPDESFTKCESVRYIVIDWFSEIKFGLFLFKNCHAFKGIVCLEMYSRYEQLVRLTSPKIVVDEFSFTDENYCPKKPEHYYLDYDYDDANMISKFISHLSQNYKIDEFEELLKYNTLFDFETPVDITRVRHTGNEKNIPALISAKSIWANIKAGLNVEQK